MSLLIHSSFGRQIGNSEGQVEADFETVDIKVIVYRDGVSVISQNITVIDIVPQVSVGLLSVEAENVLVGDEVGAPLGYQIRNGTIIIDTLGATSVFITYQTTQLTDKDGPIWSFNLSLHNPASIILPDRSTIVFLNEIPDSITTLQNRTALFVGEGDWLIKYILPLQIIPGQGEIDSVSGSEDPFGFVNNNLFLPVIVAATMISGIAIYIRRSGRSVRHASVNLRPEEEEVLRFIREQGGMVLESELRKKFILPKTSMWRMAKRLERAGLVKINRVGLQNEIELVRR